MFPKPEIPLFIRVYGGTKCGTKWNKVPVYPLFCRIHTVSLRLFSPSLPEKERTAKSEKRKIVNIVNIVNKVFLYLFYFF